MSLQDNFITTTISLAVDDRTRHWFYLSSTPRTAAQRRATIHEQDAGGAVKAVQQRIYNGRGRNDDLTLDNCSFELLPDCPTALSNGEFYKIQAGDQDLQQRYYDEVKAIVKKKLGCDQVICFNSQIRNAAKIGQEGNIQGYAVGGPHTDASPVTGDALAWSFVQQLKEEGVNTDEFKRYSYLNLWRNISNDPIHDNHLAVLDERTTAKPDDYIPKDLFGDDFDAVQYGLNARHAAHHKWYYFPQMTRTEAILFKQIDSDFTKPGRICFHMSVSDPNAPANAPDRESMEVRLMCFWKDAALNSMPTNDNFQLDLLKEPKTYAMELKSGGGGGAITTWTGSLLTGIGSLLSRIPLIGGWLASFMGGSSQQPAEYSGKASDYQARFVSAVTFFSYWPAVAKTWVEGTMASNPFAKGVRVITEALVDDTTGRQRTQAFLPQQKREIVDYLMTNEEYLGVCQKNFGIFVKERD